MAEETKKEETPKTEEAPKKEAKEEKVEEATEEVEVPKQFKKLVEEIEQMPVIELAELVKILEKKFGVSAAPTVVAGVAPEAGAAGDAGAEEKSSFNVELSAVGDKKIDVIKIVRDVTQKGLKESKDLVDAVASGSQMIRENVKKEEAEAIKKQFEEAGATVELK